MSEVILVIHLLIALGLIATVLLQRSEGGALGIGGGGGGGGGMFTARGAGSALTRMTAILAAAFFVTSITLTIISTKKSAPTSAFDKVGGSEKSGTSKKVGVPVLPKPADPSKPAVPTN
jgi:preprotein translocase subunit SecG